MARDIIQFTLFGHWGRFGNQLFEYAFLKICAEANDLEIQTPPWVGNHLFDIHDPLPSVKLPAYDETWDHTTLHPIAPDLAICRNIDYRGFCQFHTSFFRPHKDLIKKTFRPAGPLIERLGARNQFSTTRIGIHLRRGDYGRSIFYITPVAWYLDWLEKWWGKFHNPVLYIATEDVSLVKEFAKYDPITAEDFGVKFAEKMMPHFGYFDEDVHDPRQLDFFPEWYYLTQCDVIVAPNSTFSVVAAMASPYVKRFFRSNLLTQQIEEEDVWDMYPLQRLDQKDYPDVPGAWVEKTKYWTSR